ncbi:pterin-4-alpha-carbinolamine dehydratase 2, mitochondrial isoform X1 [Henckelia pumila]|uniref:pterin-4-alpha-carbinolamine dehydratase 2, mitochondrial isoform X1 n=1 Tax=Henckelia pumila TaxID=405737 RepID=UPI003C6E69DE
MIRALQSCLTSLSSVHVSLASIPPRLCRTHGRSSIFVADIVRRHDVLSSNVRSLNGVRAFCTGQDLSMKKCVPCSLKELRPMTEDAANVLILQVPGWNLVHEGDTWKLHQSWKVKTFVKGMEFLRLVADVAEAEGHHPDLHLIGWNNIEIDIWTHAVGGLTENDFILAAKISGLNLHHLLRITPTNK